MASLTNLSTAVVVLLAVATAHGSRITRQASTCNTGVSCVPLRSCPEYQSLLSNPTRENLNRIREASCNTNRRNPMVCCNSLSTPTSPPLILTPSEMPPTRNPSPPGGGESLLPTTCGQGRTGSRVTGGEDVVLGSYPWMAILGYKTDPQGPIDWACGGALINDRYIVTAAHCIVPSLPLEEIRIGEHDLDTSQDCITVRETKICAPETQSFKASQIIPHSDYDTRSTFSDDIALIRLDRPVTFNKYVQPICLPNAQLNVRSFLQGREAIVAGWGRTDGGSKSRIMQQTRIPLVDLQTCQPIYNNQLVEEQVCFGGVGGRDSCNGDSGGPVFHADISRNLNNLIGVVSFGKTCGGDPAIYTGVANYRSWIIENLRP